jgi:hypothetical protein
MLPSHASVVVAGGGPAGFMAAITAAEGGVADVVVLEATAEPLHKVRISGGGRCNVTHACWDPADLVRHYPRGGRALRGPFSRFACGDTVTWFADRGLELVTEADGRLFPRANRSDAVVDCLRKAAAAAGVRLFTGIGLGGARALAATPGGFALESRQGGRMRCDALVLASGSHPSGHRIATSLGHGLVPPVPSLFSLGLAPHPLGDLAGVAADPVRLELRVGDRRLRERGPMLITHRGLSGPAVLRLTAFAARLLKEHGYRATLMVDWSDGLSPEALTRLIDDRCRSEGRRRLGSSRPLPGIGRRLWRHLVAAADLDPELRLADLPASARRRLVEQLRRSRYSVAGRGPFGEEFVTAGGVPLGEVNLATMESRMQPGLFLVGEILDVDGVTGGFNFQHCWTSGWLAGQTLAGRGGAVT